MKSTKLLIKILVFAAILVAGDILVGTVISIYAKKQVNDNRVELLLDNKINSDIIILGSSLANNDYSPKVIAENTGYSCYNLGVSGSNIVFHETMLDLVLMSKHHPKLIIYTIDDYSTLYKVKVGIYRKDILYPYVDNDFVNDRVGEQLKKNKWATLISKSYRENVNFTNTIKYFIFGKEKIDYRINNMNEFGATIIDDKVKYTPPVFLKNDADLAKLTIEPAYKQALLSIQNKCMENNIRLIFCLPPLFSNPTPGFLNLIKSNTLPSVDIINMGEDFKDASYFYDSEHLNEKGANEFSKKIAEEIKKIKL